MKVPDKLKNALVAVDCSVSLAEMEQVFTHTIGCAVDDALLQSYHKTREELSKAIYDVEKMSADVLGDVAKPGDFLEDETHVGMTLFKSACRSYALVAFIDAVVFCPWRCSRTAHTPCRHATSKHTAWHIFSGDHTLKAVAADRAETESSRARGGIRCHFQRYEAIQRVRTGLCSRVPVHPIDACD